MLAVTRAESLNTRFTRLPDSRLSFFSRFLPCFHTWNLHMAHTWFTFPDRRLTRQQIPRASTRQHTHRHTHSHHKTPVLFRSLLGRLSALLLSSNFLRPLSPVVHASLIKSPENLRNTPVPPHTVYYSSTRRSPTNTNLFTFLPDAQTPGCPPQPSTL